MRLSVPFSAVACIAMLAAPCAWAGDVITVRIPRRSELTPVQKLNREGVEAVKKLEYEKAAGLFYKAYLYDPSDPFTLNNLGYISELQGELDKARKFYALASEQGSSANIDMSNAKQLQGKPMQYALESLQDMPMRVNRINVSAMDLLEENRGFEAVALLQQALALDPHNPFTLNNLGVANEAIGDFDSALRYYGEAVAAHSSEPAAVTLDRNWRGRSVSAMAAASSKRLQERVRNLGSAQERAEMYALHGVSSTNQNDWAAAREDFLRAYSLDPSSAFSLNNRGFVAEMDGDLETAEFFYDKARKAGDSNARVGLASQPGVEGQRLLMVASDSDRKVDRALERYSEERRRQTGPVELTPRGESPAPQRPVSDNPPPAMTPASPQR